MGQGTASQQAYIYTAALTVGLGTTSLAITAAL